MTTTTTHSDLSALDAPYDLTDDQICQFREDGFIKLKDVFDSETLAHFGEIITRLTMDIGAKQADVPLAERGTYRKAFIQVGNLWQHDAEAKAFSCSRRLAKLASDLMGVDGVRMYHDQALYKEAGGGFTPWHVDQQYWPIDSPNTITAWIPLQATPIEMGPLEFGRGSHVKNIGRELAISDESEQKIRDAVKANGVVSSFEPYDAGEISFHYGWTLHRAGPNTSDAPRKVHTVIYVDKDATVANPKNQNQENDRNHWLSSADVGTIPTGPLNPVLFAR
ncbi:MAG: phytanoyl-CoA dioxygenase family protein [Planctomycetota bacterium]